MLSPVIFYKPDSKLDPIETALGRSMRNYLLNGTEDSGKLKAYVNYAHGDESLHSLYGWEEWRLEKLRKAKHEWDPQNKMRWYAPIV